MNSTNDSERIRSAVNSLNNLLLGMQGYIGFMEGSANAQNQDTTYFGPLKELIGRASQVAGQIGSAVEGKADPVSEPTAPAPAPFQETTLPGKFHPMEALNGLLRETGVLPPQSGATPAVPESGRSTQTFFPPGSLLPGELPSKAPIQVAGFNGPPPIPETVPRRREVASAPPPVPDISPRQQGSGPPPIPAPGQMPQRPAANPVPLRPAQNQADMVTTKPRQTSNIVDPQGFTEPPHRNMPPAPAPIESSSLANVEIINRTGTKGLIMLVDDEQHLLYIASRILATDGYRVINCEDVFEALHIYENVGTSVDLVILDFSMPTMNGEDAFYELREMNTNAKIILSSGLFERDVVSRLLRKGLRAFLPKPYKRESLLQAVSTAMANQ